MDKEVTKVCKGERERLVTLWTTFQLWLEYLTPPNVFLGRRKTGKRILILGAAGTAQASTVYEDTFYEVMRIRCRLYYYYCA